MKLKLFAIAVLAFFASFGSQAFGQSINATSFPSGVEVFVDGVDTNTVTPSVIKTPAGNHTVLFSAPSGYVSVTDSVSVTDKVVPVNAVLLPVLIQGPVGPQGPQGIQGPAGETGAQGPAGRSPFQGVWSDITSYSEGDIVLFTPANQNKPNVYLNFTGSFSTTSPADDTADWLVLATASPTTDTGSTTTGNFGNAVPQFFNIIGTNQPLSSTDVSGTTFSQQENIISFSGTISQTLNTGFTFVLIDLTEAQAQNFATNQDFTSNSTVFLAACNAVSGTTSCTTNTPINSIMPAGHVFEIRVQATGVQTQPNIQANWSLKVNP